MTSSDQPGTYGTPSPQPYGTPSPQPYGTPSQQPYGAPAPGPGAFPSPPGAAHPHQAHGAPGHPHPVRAHRGSPAVTVVLTVVATLVAPLGYLLMARGAGDRYRLAAMMMQTGSELVVPTLLLLVGLALLGGVALLGGRAPLAPVVPGTLMVLVGLYGLVDPAGSFRLPVDLLGFEMGNGLSTLAAMSVPLLVGVLLVAAGAAGALGRRAGRRSIRR